MKSKLKNDAQLLEICLPSRVKSISLLLIEFLPICNCKCHNHSVVKGGEKIQNQIIVFGCKVKVCKEQDCWECPSCTKLQCTNCQKYFGKMQEENQNTLLRYPLSPSMIFNESNAQQYTLLRLSVDY